MKKDNLIYELKSKTGYLIYQQSDNRSVGKITQEIDKRFHLKLVIVKKDEEIYNSSKYKSET